MKKEMAVFFIAGLRIHGVEGNGSITAHLSPWHKQVKYEGK